jgi:hypothetical protein
MLPAKMFVAGVEAKERLFIWLFDADKLLWLWLRWFVALLLLLLFEMIDEDLEDDIDDERDSLSFFACLFPLLLACNIVVDVGLFQLPPV